MKAVDVLPGLVERVTAGLGDDEVAAVMLVVVVPRADGPVEVRTFGAGECPLSQSAVLRSAAVSFEDSAEGVPAGATRQ